MDVRPNNHTCAAAANAGWMAGADDYEYNKMYDVKIALYFACLPQFMLIFIINMLI